VNGHPRALVLGLNSRLKAGLWVVVYGTPEGPWYESHTPSARPEEPTDAPYSDRFQSAVKGL